MDTGDVRGWSDFAGRSEAQSPPRRKAEVPSKGCVTRVNDEI